MVLILRSSRDALLSRQITGITILAQSNIYLVMVELDHTERFNRRFIPYLLCFFLSSKNTHPHPPYKFIGLSRLTLTLSQICTYVLVKNVNKRL
jgi:hypothetical protein